VLNIVHKKRIILGEGKEGGTKEEQLDRGGEGKIPTVKEEVGREKVGN
jgi:hypothetical protein